MDLDKIFNRLNEDQMQKDIWVLAIFLFYKYPDGDLCFILVRLSKDIKNEDQMQNVK